MIVGSIARRYAKALFSLADEQGQVESWSSGLEALARTLSASPELREALSSPLFEKDQRRNVIGEIGKGLALPAQAQSFLLLLADARLGRIRAKVTSAVPLSPDEAKRIAAKLAEAEKAEVIVESAVDPSLLGGVVAQVGSMVYDGSVRSQLEELRRAMKH
jgi:F-type H+-transporting ATPase subunit delta